MVWLNDHSAVNARLFAKDLQRTGRGEVQLSWTDPRSTGFDCTGRSGKLPSTPHSDRFVSNGGTDSLICAMDFQLI